MRKDGSVGGFCWIALGAVGRECGGGGGIPGGLGELGVFFCCM